MDGHFSHERRALVATNTLPGTRGEELLEVELVTVITLVLVRIVIDEG